MEPIYANQLLGAAAALVAGVAVVTDLRSRRIPNLLTLPVLCGALVLRLLLCGWAGSGGLASGLAGAFVAFAAFLLPALLRGLGMGDLKLMTAIGALLGWEQSLVALVLVSLAGGVQALLACFRAGKLFELFAGLFRRLLRRPARERRALPAIPYALAIAGGTWATLLLRMLACALLAALLVDPRPAHAESTLHLGIGSQQVVSVRGGISRIAVGDPNVADVRPLGDGQVLVVGIQEGRTTLLIWRASGGRESYRLVVRRVSIEETADEVRRLLGDREGVVVRTAGDRVVIDGNAYTPEDHRRIVEILELYPDVRSLVQVDPHARQLAVREINEALARAGLRHVGARVVGSAIFLEGSVESEEEVRKAELIVRSLGEKVESLVTVGLRRMVHSEVHFLEVRKSHLSQYGVRFPLDASGAATLDAQIAAPLPGMGVEGFQAAVGSYETLIQGAGQWSLRLAIDKGHGRLLAQPTLVCASGEEAEFLAGGEVPVPLVTQNSNTVEYKKYGVRLRLRPSADREGNIQAELEAEVSELDRSVAVAVGPTIAVPGFRNRRVRTTVTVRSGETIVLSGLYSRDEQKAVSKVPLLSSIPILGELFKQRAFDDVERELLVFITPRLVNAGSEFLQRKREEMEGRYRQAESEVGFDLFD